MDPEGVQSRVMNTFPVNVDSRLKEKKIKDQIQMSLLYTLFKSPLSLRTQKLMPYLSHTMSDIKFKNTHLLQIAAQIGQQCVSHKCISSMHEYEPLCD